MMTCIAFLLTCLKGVFFTKCSFSESVFPERVFSVKLYFLKVYIPNFIFQKFWGGENWTQTFSMQS